MTGLPTLLVKLDDGTGTFPYDVSAFVRLPAGVSITRGRSDEFNQVSPSSLTLTFDNTTGVFTLGSGTYGIAIDQRIQVTMTISGAVKVFTGYVQDWPVAWPDGSDQFAVAEVTAIDRLARLARRKLRSITEHEILLDAPNYYYPLTEASDAIAAGDISGNTAQSLVIAGTGTAPAFGGASPNTWDGVTGCTFAAGQRLEAPFTISSSTNMTSEIAFLRASNPASVERLFAAGLAVDIAMNTSGQITVATAGVTSPLSYADGTWHHAAVTWDSGTGVATLYIDGSSVASAVAGGSATFLSVGGDGFGGTTFTGTLAHAALWLSKLSAARILAHANALRNGFATDTADQRIARLAAYANIATADQSLETGQQPSIAPQSTAGQSVLDAMQTVMAAEGGLVFNQGDGKLVMQNKSHRVLKATGAAAIAFTADQVNPDLAAGGAKNYLINTATGSRDGGAQQRSVYAAGVAANEEYPDDLSVALLPTDALLLNLLQWTTALYGTPRPRIPSLTIDLLTTASSVTVQAVLALEIGDLITISGLPTQKPSALGGLLVEGWTQTLTHDSWEITLNTVPSDLFKAWVLGDATYGVLDSTTRLYF